MPNYFVYHVANGFVETTRKANSFEDGIRIVFELIEEENIPLNNDQKNKIREIGMIALIHNNHHVSFAVDSTEEIH